MKSLLARLLLVVSIALLPALAFQAYTESQARRVRYQLVEDEARRLVRLVSAEQQRIVEGAEQALNALTGAPAVLDNLPEECPRLLANLLAQSPRYVFAGVIGLDGHFVCASGPFDRSVDTSDRAYFRDALRSGGFVIGAYVVGRVVAKPAIQMAKPFRTRDGTIAGVVELGLGLDWLGRQLERFAWPRGAAVSVADRNGIVLARIPDGPRYVGRAMLPENLFSLHGSEIGIADMQGIDGVMRLVAYSPLDAEPKGLRIAVGLDRDITFAAMTRANCTELVLIGAGAGLALAITAVLGRAVIRGPLDRLLVVAESWRSGDLVARTGIAANGSEFSRLAAAFDRMAEAQEVREHALRTALESTTDSVVVLDRDWRYTYLNERAKAQIGRGRDLLGKAVWDAFPGAAEHPGGEASEADDFYAMFGSRFETHAYPSADGMTIFFRDVTEERRNEQRFRTMFEQAAVGMMLAGLDRVPLQVNDRLCEITGYPREELLAKSFRDITHPDDRGMDDAQTRALLAGEIATFTVEKRYLRKDGQVVWVSLTVSLLRDQEGRPECHFGVIADITARQHRSGENLNE